MDVINTAAKRFGSPSLTAIQVTTLRQLKAASSKTVVPVAAIHGARRPPRRNQMPHKIDREPKEPPEIRAVFAAAGFER